MSKREFKCVLQRVLVNMETHADAVALCDEIMRLRSALGRVRDMAASAVLPSVLSVIDQTLED